MLTNGQLNNEQTISLSKISTELHGTMPGAYLGDQDIP
jgi:hypothetical protein